MPFPVDIAWVKATEAKLRTSFPLGFVARMVTLNGGEVEADGDTWELFPFLDKSDRKRLKRTCNDIVLETGSARAWPGFPPDGVAIAGNGTADRLILVSDPTAPDRLQPGVFFWDHETGEMAAVAEDFADLRSPSSQRRHAGGKSVRRRRTKS
jgi:hypothetical protein